MTSTEQMLVSKTKALAYRELYLELLQDHRIPYDFCLKVKEKINALEAILFVDEYLEIPPLPSFEEIVSEVK
jgi:hypothetical protein